MPEYAEVKEVYITRPHLLKLFSKLFTPADFFAVWEYMQEYVSYEESSALGQYYMRGQSSLLPQLLSYVPADLSSYLYQSRDRDQALSRYR